MKYWVIIWATFVTLIYFHPWEREPDGMQDTFVHIHQLSGIPFNYLEIEMLGKRRLYTDVLKNDWYRQKIRINKPVEYRIIVDIKDRQSQAFQFTIEPGAYHAMWIRDEGITMERRDSLTK
jgi:hypothetical protein